MDNERLPLVSVVISSYNYGRYIKECIDSALRQVCDYPVEVVVVDDASTDDSVQIIKSITDPRLRVFCHDKNHGGNETIKEGICRSRGAFIARIDSDDRYRPHFLKTLLPKFEHGTGIGMVYADAAMINENGDITQGSCDDVHGGTDFCGNELLALLEKNYVCAPTVIARREAWERAVPFWEGLSFLDWPFNLLTARNCDLYYVQEVVADYRVHPQNYHHQIILNKSEEPSILRVLDHFFSTPEKTPELETLKQQARGRIFAAQYLTLAEKYFGAGHYADARRCYRQVWRNQPRRMLHAGPLRRWGATYLGQRIYEGLKRMAKLPWTGTRKPSPAN
jgi:glycosyltransferase involved in cell wall biosynthesis